MDRLANEGALHEDDVLRRWPVVSRQDEVVLDLLPTVRVVGHVDGVLETDALIEVKSMGDEPYKAWIRSQWDTPGLVQKYKWQVSVYMLAADQPLFFIVKNRNTGEIDECILQEPFYSKQEIMARVLEMEKWVRRGELPDECDVNNYPCPFYYLEQQLSMELAEDEIIDELAKMYNEAGIAVKVAESRKKEARKALDAGLAGRERVVTAKSRVVYYQAKTKRFQVEKAKDDGVDVEKYYVETIDKRLRVTVKDDEGDGDGRDESGGDANGTTPNQRVVEGAAEAEGTP